MCWHRDSNGGLLAQSTVAGSVKSTEKLPGHRRRSRALHKTVRTRPDDTRWHAIAKRPILHRKHTTPRNGPFCDGYDTKADLKIKRAAATEDGSELQTAAIV